MKKEAPVDRGRLRQSIQILRKTDNSIYVGSNVGYASAVQYGSVPHRPPLVPLEKWVRRKLGASKPESWAKAKGLQDKIEEEGTEPNPYLTRAIENLRDKYG